MGGIFSYDNPIMSAISKIANCILLIMINSYQQKK